MYISYQICGEAQKLNGIAARIGSGEFVILLPQATYDVKKLEPGIIGQVQDYDASIKFLPTIGIYMIQDKTLPIAQVCNRTAIIAASRKDSYAGHVAVYQDSIKKLIENRQEILFGIKSGLGNRESVVYYQSQVSARTSHILTAEVLVRQQHPQHSLLPSGELIPILEISGFIYKLDSYVWGEVCRFLHDKLMRKLQWYRSV